MREGRDIGGYLPLRHGQQSIDWADRATFEENFYNRKAPWDIGKPQGTFAAVADRVTGPVLDAGCGTGEHALFFAARGHRVTGIDFVERHSAGPGPRRPIGAWRWSSWSRSAGRGRWSSGKQFASVIDCGLFHCFSDDDRRRVRPRAGAGRRAGRPAVPDVFQQRGTGSKRGRGGCRGGSCTTHSPTTGRSIPSRPTRIDVNPEFTEVKFSEGRPKAWFAVVRRTG